uniref:Uncharacterized protein n=1 Tax=Candidatus Kentrum sp. TUN TaxID=2126343 RepID=A0A450ZZ62_9GAMM|nr:MAG: hypothetical protein BECKTUN1418F_GA0071002_11626 [Candidatus Kentron sp. TUN]VFK67582.1 MAG: hypothetical protein BECKTUN1418E_GA0071001_11566 [Candidatus Kentron sp. TUN]
MSSGSGYLDGNVSFTNEDGESFPVEKGFSYDMPSISDGSLPPQRIIGRIIVYQTTFDTKTKKWKFKYNNSLESMDVSECEISSLVIERGFISVNDSFKVELEITEKKRGNLYRNTYKVIKLIQPIWAPRQHKMPLND